MGEQRVSSVNLNRDQLGKRGVREGKLIKTDGEDRSGDSLTLISKVRMGRFV